MRSIALILLALLPIKAAFADITEAKVTGGAVGGTTEQWHLDLQGHSIRRSAGR